MPRFLFAPLFAGLGAIAGGLLFDTVGPLKSIGSMAGHLGAALGAMIGVFVGHLMSRR